jgi:heme exporter protein C
VERTERLLRGFELGLFFLVAVLMPLSLYCVFRVVPNEVTMGAVQRIFYFHVPSAWVAFLGFFVVFVSSILYLATRRLLWDVVAHSAAELGVLFCSIVLFTGPIWARPVWGTWWTWEARLTTTLVLEMVFVAYLVLRTQAENRTQAARLSAVVGIVGFLDVPIIYYSVQIWRGHHPIVFKSSGGQGLEPIMLKTFMLCMTTFTLFFLVLLAMRIRLGLLRESVSELRQWETQSGA